MATRISRISPMPEALLGGGIVFALMGMMSWLMYSQCQTILFEEFRRGLASTVQAAALSVDGAAHRTLHHADGDAMSSEIYLRLHTQLRRMLLSDTSYAYIYSTIADENGYHFVVDAGDPKSDDFSPLMDKYVEWQDNTALQISKETASIVVSEEPYTDEWGTFISAYAPILDAEGDLVAVLGIDVELKDYYMRVQPLKVAAIRSLIGSLMVAVVVGALLWISRRRVETEGFME